MGVPVTTLFGTGVDALVGLIVIVGVIIRGGGVGRKLNAIKKEVIKARREFMTSSIPHIWCLL